MPRPENTLAPSLLAGDHAALHESLQTVADLGLHWAHVDIMDGHFVPNLTFGPQTVKALRARDSERFFDVHLMLDNPQAHWGAFAEAGADNITIHVEPDYDIAATLRAIGEKGLSRGLAFNPDTPVEAVEPYLEAVDLILAMTVPPGFGGQGFREDVLPKIEALAKWREERALLFRIEVDGGVDLQTAPRCAAAGADTFVCGTAFFKATDRTAFARAFTQL